MFGRFEIELFRVWLLCGHLQALGAASMMCLTAPTSLDDMTLQLSVPLPTQLLMSKFRPLIRSITTSTWLVSLAVSYTHLDVYKRQRLWQSFRVSP